MFYQMNRYPRLREETERIITTYIREKEQVIRKIFLILCILNKKFSTTFSFAAKYLESHSLPVLIHMYLDSSEICQNINFDTLLTNYCLSSNRDAKTRSSCLSTASSRTWTPTTKISSDSQSKSHLHNLIRPTSRRFVGFSVNNARSFKSIT